MLLETLIVIGLACAACKAKESEPPARAASAGAGSYPADWSSRMKELALSSETSLLAEMRRRQAGVKTSGDLAAYSDDEIMRVLRFQQKVVYGTDDRREVQAVADPEVRRRSESVVSLFLASDVLDNGDGSSTLRTRPFFEAYDLCEGEPFRTQPIGAFCSGFLVGDDIVATAGHCAGTADFPPEDIRFVFGFRLLGAHPPLTIPNAEIYAGTAILGRELTSTGEDWALVLLDRKVTGRTRLAVRREGKVDDGAALYVIGHPCGLPAKHGGNATVRDNGIDSHFVCNLDTYGGNSGSPVFDAVTHVVEGILVRGETDFVTRGDCNQSLICPDTGCRGEDCTRTTRFSALLPAH